MEYEIKFHPMALQEFCSLDGSVKKLVKKQLDKLKTSPLLGEELGNKNGYDLTGYRKMYACKKQIRIVYSVVENVLLVNIIAIGKREELEVYKTASERVWNAGFCRKRKARQRSLRVCAGANWPAKKINIGQSI